MSAIKTMCPDEDLFVRLQQGELVGEERDGLMRHIDGCASCSELLRMLTELEQPAHALHSEELLPGKRKKKPLMIGRYEVIEQAGVGGLGVVYKARDTRLDRIVAVKLLRPDVLAARPEQAREAAQRLQREGRALARQDHPHIVAIYDMDTHEGQFFTACAFIDGGNLRDWCGQAARSWREVLALCVQVARALTAAHEMGVIHRDVKPENVLLRAGEDHALLTDFGMATLPQGASTTRFITDDLATQQGMVLGTPAYMSPEQLDGQSATAASDQFSFCVMLYEALYGFRPYHATDYQELLLLLKRGELVKPSSSTIPDPLFEVLHKGLRPMSAERHQDMRTLTERLEALLEGGKESTTTPLARRLWLPAVATIIIITIISAATIKNKINTREDRAARGDEGLSVSHDEASSAPRLAAPAEPPVEDVRPLEEGSGGDRSQATDPLPLATQEAQVEQEPPAPEPVALASLTTSPTKKEPVTSPPAQKKKKKAQPPSPSTTTPPAFVPGAPPPASLPPDLAQLLRDTFEDRRDFMLSVTRYDARACKKHFDSVVAVMPDWEFAQPENLFRLRCEYLRGDCKLASEFERLLPDQIVPMDAAQIARHNLVYAHPSCLKSTEDRLQAAAHHALDACTNPMLKKSCKKRMDEARALIEANPDHPVIKERKVSDSINWVILELAKQDREGAPERASP